MRSVVVMLATSSCLMLLCGVTASAAAQTPGAGPKEVTVITGGVGADPEAARKDALMNAVKQTVGAFVDGETLVKDEKIQEQILEVSNAFVTKYDEVRPAAKGSDGLYRITVKAVVKRLALQEKIGEVRSISARTPGKDVVAEVITKVENAEQGSQLLKRYLKGLEAKLLVARLVGEDGKPAKDVRPKVKRMEDGRIECTWYIEVYFNLPLYYETACPQLDKVFTAVSSRREGPVTIVGERAQAGVSVTNYPVFHFKDRMGFRGFSMKEIDKTSDAVVWLSIGRDKFGGNERFRRYLLQAPEYMRVLDEVSIETPRLAITVLGPEKQVIRQEETWCAIKAPPPTDWDTGTSMFLRMRQDQYDKKSPSAVFVSPRFGNLCYVASMDLGEAQRDGGTCSDTLLMPLVLVFDKDDLNRVRELSFRFDAGIMHDGNKNPKAKGNRSAF